MVPLEDALLTEVSAPIELRSEGDACIRYVLAEYAPGSGEVLARGAIAFRSLMIDPARSTVRLGSLPMGDWIVRVVAHFSTEATGQKDAAVIERFFRVINTDIAGPLPVPENLPAAACAPLPADGVSPELVLVGAGPEPVHGTQGTDEPPVTTVQIGSRVEIRVTGDACAIGWRVGGTRVDSGDQWEYDQADNPTNDPFRLLQNRWLLHDLPTGLFNLTATTQFSVDTIVTNRWLLDVRGGLEIPSARVVAPDQTVTPSRGCGASWSFADATGGFEPCDTNPLPSVIPTLSVAPGTPVRVDVPGWTISGWSAACGRADEAGNPDYPFVTIDECDLGYRYAQYPSAPPLVPVFLPRASGPLVQIWLTVSRGNDMVSWSVFVLTSIGS